MRCLLVNHSPVEGSGSGAYTEAVAEHLTRLGVRTCILTPACETREYVKGDITYRTIKVGVDGLTEGAFPTFTGHPSSAATYAELSLDQIREYRSRVCSAIAETAREHHANIIHTQHLFLLPQLAKETRCAVVTTCHGSELHFCVSRNSPYWWKVLTDAVKCTDRLVSVSRYVARLAEKACNVPNASGTVIHNGFDQETFFPAPTGPVEVHKRERGGWMVAAVGRLVQYKRFDVFLKAVQILQNRLGPEVIHVQLIGDGPQRAPLMRLAEELNVRNISFRGFLPKSIVAQTLSSADATVVPSEHEPFGLVALESLACGTPVVASATGGIPEIIDDAVGTLVHGWEPHTWAQALLGELRRDAKKIKQAEILRRASIHTWECVAAKLLNVYELALG